MTTDTAAPTGPWHAFWRWNVAHSPLARRIRAHRYATRLIAAAGLPAPIAARIDTTIRRTRLWADERADIARELIAHAADALAAGRTEPEVLATLGEPRPVARLIRRAAKRKRSWPYQLRTWATRALAAGFALVLLSYAALAAVYFTGRPNIKTNYLAKLNATNALYTDDQKAHPAYHDIGMDWRRIAQPLRDTSAIIAVASADERPDPPVAGVDALPDLTPDHPDYDATVAAFRAFRPRLDDLAAATRLPVIGYPYSDRSEYRAVEGVQHTWPYPLPPSDDPAQQDPLVGVLLPYLGESRTLAKLLAYDARLAAEEADPDRAVAALSAAARMAAQLGREPFLIAQLVGHSIYHLAIEHTFRILHHHPGLLGPDHLTDLAHALAATRDDALRLDFTAESYWIEDFLQRAYTDDGHGNGRLTPQGVQLLHQMVSPPDDFGLNFDDFPALTAAASPAQLVVAPSRAQQLATHHAFMRRLTHSMSAGPSDLAALKAWSDEVFEDGNRPTVTDPVRLLTPAHTSAVARWYQSLARADAAATVLAIEAYRATHGHLPESLDALTPRYLPALPEDPFDPGRPIKHRPHGDTYTVYFVGADGDDDGGKRPIDRYRSDFARRVDSLTARFTPDYGDIPDADWVLYPPTN